EGHVPRDQRPVKALAHTLTEASAIDLRAPAKDVDRDCNGEDDEEHSRYGTGHIGRDACKEGRSNAKLHPRQREGDSAIERFGYETEVPDDTVELVCILELGERRAAKDQRQQNLQEQVYHWQ